MPGRGFATLMAMMQNRLRLPRPTRVARSGPVSERTAFATGLFLVLFGGDVLRNSIDWAGWAIVVGLFAVAAIVVVVRNPIPWKRFPPVLALFLLFIVASLAWSRYPAGSALGIVVQLLTTAAPIAMAATMSWPAIVRALGRALRIIVVLSLLFELVVSVFVRHPICPVFLDCSVKHPAAFEWSRDLLFHGGQIQGLSGNSNLLAIIALLALVVTACQAAARVIPKRTGWVGIVSAVLALGLTRSSTVIVCAVVCAVVLGLALLVRRVSQSRRWMVAVGALVVVVIVALAVLAEHRKVLHALGKSSTLTGRTDIWSSVIDLAQQHPVFGWGWIGYWQPAYKPFSHLATKNGVTYLQAHEAYLDVWFQVGFVGLAIFLALVVSTLARSWWWATDRRMLGPNSPAPWSPLDLLPLLLATVLVVHGLGESRILVEWGWATLALLALVTRVDRFRWWGAPPSVAAAAAAHRHADTIVGSSVTTSGPDVPAADADGVARPTA